MRNALSASDASALVAAAVDWLVDSGLGGSDLRELVAGLGRRLNAGGAAVDRAGCATLTLHPQIVSQEVTWCSEDDSATTRYYTPSLMEDPENRRGPYFELALNRLKYKRFFLKDGAEEDMSLLARLRAEGYTEYFGFFHATGGAAAITPFARRVGLVPCVVGSFATRRPSGFGDAEIDCFKSVSTALALAAKARANFDTGSRLLDIYIGRACGSQVLDGRIMRGDSERIACGIWLCDLRQSSRLVSQMPLDDYITLLNRYFDVTVGAVMEAGGEVLKFIGDAVLGIFRSDRPGSDLAMREHALAASMRTLRDVRALNAAGRPLEVGIALHVGDVMYGNVGIDERLDFTVIGRAVNEAARLQGLTKQLGQPVLASAAFAEPIPERFDFAGAHAVAGFDDMLETYAPRT
ncbi:MAG: adenylate/guanylate cyclase domain-containing protein [Ensifer adhaerens]